MAIYTEAFFPWHRSPRSKRELVSPPLHPDFLWPLSFNSELIEVYQGVWSLSFWFFAFITWGKSLPWRSCSDCFFLLQFMPVLRLVVGRKPGAPLVLKEKKKRIFVKTSQPNAGIFQSLLLKPLLEHTFLRCRHQAKLLSSEAHSKRRRGVDQEMGKVVTQSRTHIPLYAFERTQFTG